MSSNQNSIYCEDITSDEQTNLWQVSKTLHPEKRRFFNAAYASFRILDNYIEDLTLSSDERKEILHQWSDLCDKAKNGQEILPKGNWIGHSAIFEELKWGFENFAIDFNFWSYMHDSMDMDINESPMIDWNDFEAYSLGGTVSPTAIFLYILMAVKHDKKWVISSNIDLLKLATPIGRFCYLVHIIRDIFKDASSDASLITIPIQALQFADLTKEKMVDMAKRHTQQNSLSDDEKKQFLTLITEILKYAHIYNKQAVKQMTDLAVKLPKEESKALKNLVLTYYGMFITARDHPEKIFDKGGITTTVEQRGNTTSRSSTPVSTMTQEEILGEICKITHDGVTVILDTLELIPPIAKSIQAYLRTFSNVRK